MKKALVLAVAAGLLAMPLQASDGVATEGRLSDKDFFRLATCGATPGGDCISPTVRWPQDRITLALAPAQRRYSPDLARRVSREIDRAIAEINGAGAGIRITRDDNLKDPDIIVSLPALSEGELTRNIPHIPNGQPIGVGFMWLWWNDRAQITQASMLISEDIAPADLPSVVLEELFQCLGFLYDIENRYYEGRSILSQDSNGTTSISGQDRMALRKLYP
ncbi:hypothetical protein [Tabrizicola oligotrophica]|uniref:DUF2927 domain-containing protein n=1 Tax=Tabrizicola oligotrophica TaxID=2710650 RepID=A0A6M0QX05_9RHOB|nr:hypothetical protein [Tabrizicola oligotrophica]NEY91032.1 hypothetical protein [Tabrizicola oligotrophica]